MGDVRSLAFIVGTSLFGSKIFETFELVTVATDYGEVSLYRDDRFLMIPRHGVKKNIPPHRINYKANIAAIKKLDVERIVAINSVGSLKKEIAPGMLVVPHDYINLWSIETFFDNEIYHIVPSLDEETRRFIISHVKNVGGDVVENGVYIQTTGPRLETKAEIDFLKNFGDIVGMTMANEATLSKEANISYATLCSIDNYCHGIVEEELTYEKIREASKRSLNIIEAFIKKIIKK